MEFLFVSFWRQGRTHIPYVAANQVMELNQRLERENRTEREGEKGEKGKENGILLAASR